MIDARGLAQFQDEGWLALGRIADDTVIRDLTLAEARFRLDLGYGARDNQTLRVNIQLCDRSESVRRFCTTGPGVEAMKTLIGPNVCLTHQQFVTKLPDGSEQHSDIPFHQDNGYGRLEPMTDVTIWMPLVDTDEENGALWIVPGSQRAGLVEHGEAAVNPVLREAKAEAATMLPLAAGEAVAFSGLLLHGSGRNRSAAPRPAIFVRYCEPHAVAVSDGEERRPVLDEPHSWMVAGDAE